MKQMLYVLPLALLLTITTYAAQTANLATPILAQAFIPARVSSPEPVTRTVRVISNARGTHISLPPSPTNRSRTQRGEPSSTLQPATTPPTPLDQVIAALPTDWNWNAPLIMTSTSSAPCPTPTAHEIAALAVIHATAAASHSLRAQLDQAS